MLTSKLSNTVRVAINQDLCLLPAQTITPPIAYQVLLRFLKCRPSSKNMDREYPSRSVSLVAAKRTII